MTKQEQIEEECDVVDDYTIGFVTYLMQKRRNEVDRMQSEIIIKVIGDYEND